MIRILLFLIILACSQASFAQPDVFGVARQAAPVLNSPDFGSVFGGKDRLSIKSDRCGQVRELEYIALPGTLFRILEEQQRGAAMIYRVETAEYPAPAGIRLYVDSRFLELQSAVPPSRTVTLPAREQVVATLKKSLGSSYVWGGNLQGGVPQLAEWFYGNISPAERERLTLSGLDCSGLLYQATGGWTPRNTSQLVAYGRAVNVAGRKSDQIMPMLEPLDLIVWNGHVVIVLDRHTAIESRLACGKPGNGGVVATPLAERLREIMRTRRPADVWPGGSRSKDLFVVRRWYGFQSLWP